MSIKQFGCNPFVLIMKKFKWLFRQQKNHKEPSHYCGASKNRGNSRPFEVDGPWVPKRTAVIWRHNTTIVAGGSTNKRHCRRYVFFLRF